MNINMPLLLLLLNVSVISTYANEHLTPQKNASILAWLGNNDKTVKPRTAYNPDSLLNLNGISYSHSSSYSGRPDVHTNNLPSYYGTNPAGWIFGPHSSSEQNRQTMGRMYHVMTQYGVAPENAWLRFRQFQWTHLNQTFAPHINPINNPLTVNGLYVNDTTSYISSSHLGRVQLHGLNMNAPNHVSFYHQMNYARMRH